MTAAEAYVPRISRASAWVVAGAFGALLLGVLIPFFLTVLLPYLSTGVPPADWTPWRVWLALGGAISLLAFLGFILFQRYTTHVSVRGISVWTLRGRCKIPWEDVQQVGVQGHDLILVCVQRRVIVHAACYENTQDLVHYINLRLATVVPLRTGHS